MEAQLASSSLGKRGLDVVELPLSVKRQRRASIDSTRKVCEFTQDLQDSESNPNTPLSPTSTTATSVTGTREKKFKCFYLDCGKVFVRPCRLDEHLRSHTNTRPFACSYTPCDKSFLRQSHLDHHEKSAHTKVREHVCAWPGCGKGFVSRTRLRHHNAVHDGENKYRCTEYGDCFQVFRKHATLQRHIDKDHLNADAYRCTEVDGETGQACAERFKTPSKLATHKHKNHTVRVHICTICTDNNTNGASTTFPSYADLQLHTKATHPPICFICFTTCTSNADLRRHNQLAHPETVFKKPYIHKCPHEDCGKSFNKASNLKTHVTNVHGRQKAFTCGEADHSQSLELEEWTDEDGCGKAFTSKQSLKQHIRRHHLDTEPRAARKIRKPHASAGVTTMSRLTGEGYAEESGRNIACSRDGCVHRFYRAYDLKVHLDTFHGLEDFEIDRDMVELEALNGGRFWLGGQDADVQDEAEDDDEFMVLKEKAREMASLSGRVEAIDPMLS